MGLRCYRILEGSDAWNRDAFEYPTDVIIRPVGDFVVRRGMEYRPLDVIQGAIRTLDGRIPGKVYYTPRHVGGDITNDSIVIYADMGDLENNVGWFSVEPV